MSLFTLTDPGEGLLEAELVTWRVAVGEKVQVNDVICEVETAKSIVELPSPWAGTVRELLISEGQTVPVGTALIDIETANEAGREVPAAPAASVTPAADSAAADSALLVGYGPRTENQSGETKAAAPTAPTWSSTSPLSQTKAKPPVRRLARDAGVDLKSLTGTGPDGVITRADVLAAATASQPTEKRVTQNGVQRVMAHTMTAALDVPHATVWREVDLLGTMNLVATLRANKEFSAERISPLLIFCKAVCVALARYPELNSSYDAAKHELTLKARVNLGIATATPRGLVVPNVKGAESRQLLELNQEINRIVTGARDGTLNPEDSTGGSFTITNVGVLGIDSGTPIVNYGETGIACLGAIRNRPWVVGDEIVIRPIATIALGFDHRVIDGETGARFLADVATIMENPAMMMALG